MKKLKSKKYIQSLGFTLTEILIYITVLVILLLIVSSFFLWTSRSNIKARAMREVLDNGRRVMEVMNYEIREAKSIYYPTSTSTQLSIETTKYLPEGEETTHLDFYLCGTTFSTLCFKKEAANPLTLTSERVMVKNLIFSQIATTSTIPSIQINLEVAYKAPSDKPEYQASIKISSVVSLRSY